MFLQPFFVWVSCCMQSKVKRQNVNVEYSTNDLFRLRLFFPAEAVCRMKKHRFEYQGFGGSKFHVVSLAARFGRLDEQHHMNWWCNFNWWCSTVAPDQPAVRETLIKGFPDGAVILVELTPVAAPSDPSVATCCPWNNKNSKFYLYCYKVWSRVAIFFTFLRDWEISRFHC